MTCEHTHKDDPENAVCEDCYNENRHQVGEWFSKEDVKEAVEKLKEKFNYFKKKYPKNTMTLEQFEQLEETFNIDKIFGEFK